ncbi:LIF receptor subunit alpha b isoform X2 [Brachyhypopomus gauderio]|uniref:LIF receptor subunit alpha b isoform X2 n=1 Tax=Brachyhypopomus gauderio TaxID=698409 RepID=UPI0040416C42
MIRFPRLIMASVHFCLLCTLLSLPIAQGNQDGHPLAVPEVVRIYKGESDPDNFGVWKMNIEWRANFTNSYKPEKVAYDVEIFHTERMTLVHDETIEVNNPSTTYQWSWTSPIPLQCTSHSVRLRFRDHTRTSDWTPLYTLHGEDAHVMSTNMIYPQNPVVLVNDSIVFCCILTPENVRNFTSSSFTLRISNHTYVTRPIQYSSISPSSGFDITCNGSGSTAFTGHAPDVRNFMCETRDLTSVECHWSLGRSTGLAYNIKYIEYSVNGRNCSGTNICSDICTCVLADGIDKGVVNWTLTAKNALGKKIISDVADPKHRVRLKAPVLEDPIFVYKRSATLQWKWNAMKSRSFPLICEVEVNGQTVEGTFSGTSLESLVLPDLQPFTNYTARVRCGSLEHFYEWGDWSNPTTFITKEDIPQPIDVWVQVLGEQTCVIWKNPTVSQSHGIITGYELLLGSSKTKSEAISKSATEHFHKFSSGVVDFISVSAKNSAGYSPPSSVIIPSLFSDSDIKTSAINETHHHDGFYMFWEPSPIATCGYVVDWVPTFRTELCAVKWKKMPPGVLNASISSDFEEGRRYTLSVYACTSGAAHLLQRREGYVKELSPSGQVQNLTAVQHGPDVVLSWEEVPNDKQRGFIQGYTISYKPFKEQIDQIIISITTALVILTCAFIAITILCYRKREWLKSALYPEIPKPRLSETWFTEVQQCPVFDKMLTAESEALMITKPELYPQVVQEVTKDQELTALKSKDPPQTESCKNTWETQTIPSLITNLSYIKAPCPVIENPTYNLTMALPSDANQVSNYRPQIQSPSDEIQPCQVRSVHMDSMDYQPQPLEPLTDLQINSVEFEYLLHSKI